MIIILNPVQHIRYPFCPVLYGKRSMLYIKQHVINHKSFNLSRCGLEFPIPHTRLAAHCDPESEYCCNEDTGWCGNTQDHCNDTLSLNMKNIIPESHAQWVVTGNSNEHVQQCDLKKFLSKEACNILAKTVRKIIFLGMYRENILPRGEVFN